MRYFKMRPEAIFLRRLHKDSSSSSACISTSESQRSEKYHSHDLETFTLFPKLPIELRLRILRFAFPSSCRITFPFRYITGFFRDMEKNVSFQSKEHSSIPITFSINRESRAEPARTYSVILRDDYYRGFAGNGVGVPRPWKMPISYDAERDILEIDFIRILLRSQNYLRCFSYLHPKAPRVLLGTTILEVSGWDWVTGVATMIRGDDIEELYFAIPRIDDPDCPKLRVFRYFPNLEVVKLVRTPHYQSLHVKQNSKFSPDQCRIELARVQKWFEQNKETFTKGVPSITMVD